MWKWIMQQQTASVPVKMSWQIQLRETRAVNDNKSVEPWMYIKKEPLSESIKNLTLVRMLSTGKDFLNIIYR